MSVGTTVSESEARRLARRMPDQVLVAWATELAEKMGGSGKGEDSQIKSQISRAAEAAGQSPAISLFQAWVRYQYARPGSSQFWSTRTSFDNKESDMAHAILQIVHRVADQLKEAAQAGAGAGPGAAAGSMLVERATMHATARFLGFLRRAVVAEAGWEEA